MQEPEKTTAKQFFKDTALTIASAASAPLLVTGIVGAIASIGIGVAGEAAVLLPTALTVIAIAASTILATAAFGALVYASMALNDVVTEKVDNKMPRLYKTVATLSLAAAALGGKMAFNVYDSKNGVVKDLPTLSATYNSEVCSIAGVKDECGKTTANTYNSGYSIIGDLTPLSTTYNNKACDAAIIKKEGGKLVVLANKDCQIDIMNF